MKLSALLSLLFAACLSIACVSFADGDNHSAQRRYLNEVFDSAVRTPNIVYAEAFNNTTGKTEKLTMRVFEPKGDKLKKRPLFVLTPGGGFVQHEDYWMDDFGEQLAKAGYVVAINRYRLSDSIGTADKYIDALAKAVADQRSVIEYFVRDANGPDKFRIDPENIFIGGHSAGAISSLHQAYLNSADETDPEMIKAFDAYGNMKKQNFSIRGVINLSGLVTDLDIIDKGEAPLLSLHGDQDDVIFVGTRDPNLYGAIPIHEQADKVGLKNELYVIRGAGHNDTSDTVLCPECVPLVRRFMFNELVAVDSDK